MAIELPHRTNLDLVDVGPGEKPPDDQVMRLGSLILSWIELDGKSD